MMQLLVMSVILLQKLLQMGHPLWTVLLLMIPYLQEMQLLGMSPHLPMFLLPTQLRHRVLRPLQLQLQQM
jgi:hypothetical protein